MIKFKGELTGNAEKCFIKKNSRAEQITLLAVLVLSFPGVILTAQYTSIDARTTIRTLCILYAVFMVLALLFPYFPWNLKDKSQYMPKEIYINKQHIVCVSDKHTDSKLTKDVKVVYDYGDYYDILFPIGHYSSVFVCQKNLLIKGSLAEFESVFDGKIVKKS
jgi:hypothetical protein